MACWENRFRHMLQGASYLFGPPISMLRRLRNEDGRRKSEIRAELLDQLRVRRKNELLVNRSRIACIDDLHLELIASHELVGRINITAGISLVDEPAVSLIRAALNNLASRHDRFDECAVTIQTKLKELA